MHANISAFLKEYVYVWLFCGYLMLEIELNRNGIIFFLQSYWNRSHKS